jgi:ubiquitin carboxyl-terminal hydrolase 9/13
LPPSQGGLPRINTSTSINNLNALSPHKPKTPTAPTSARNPGVPANPSKPEDKESPEYKKKQAMLNGPILPMTFDNSAAYDMTESLFTSLKDIFEAIIANQSRTGVVSPAKFLEILRKENEMFRTSMHQDAHEFLNLLLNEVVANVEANSKKLEATKAMNGSIDPNAFEKALAAAKIPNTTGSRTPSNTGWVHELFEGTLTSETKCLTCENVSQRDEAFLDLSVDLEKHSSVTSCLRKFSEEEMLCERNKFHCDKCGGLQEAEKRMKIKRLPKILALHLKRFKYTEDLQRLQKLFHRVVYPYHLRLFNTTDDAEDPDRLYELYAVVVHIGGGPYHGHYVSIIKTQDRGWLLFDDEMVEPVDKNYVRNFFGERPGLACAYVLFYQETTLEAVKREQEAEGLAAAAEDIPLTTTKETPILGLKTNGHVVAPPLPANSPAIDHWDSLDRSATATLPPLSPTHHPIRPTETAPTISTNSSFFPALSPKKSDIQSKKELAKAEKAQKALEKEQEKNQRARIKAAEAVRKAHEQRQLNAAMEANRTSSSIDPKSLMAHNLSVALGDGVQDGEVPASTAPSSTAVSFATQTTAAEEGNRGLASNTLSRFRQTSKSLKKGPKFWGNKGDKDDAGDGEAQEDSVPPPGEKKGRFSGLGLRSKKSSAMLL